MPDSRSLPGLDKSPKKNWVEKAGGLPSYIERIAKHLHHEKGHSVSAAIAMAISTVKRWAAGGENVKADTRAKAAKAVAAWEKLKAKAGSKKLREAARLEIRMTPEEERDLAHRFAGRLMVAEGVLRSLGSGSAAGVANATALLEADAGERVRFQIVRGSADEREVVETRERLLAEIELLSELSEALCPGVLEEMKGKATEAADQATRTSHLQRRLTSLGHQLKDDGVFGPKTDEAVKGFQKRAGLKDDGVVGEKTGEALRGGPAQASLEDEPGADGAATNADGTPADGAVDSAAAALDPARVLFKGIGVGEEAGDPGVQALQGVVGAEGDGRFGPETEKAVKKFQRKAGLKPDGIVAEKTHRVLAGQAKGKEIAEAFLAGRREHRLEEVRIPLKRLPDGTFAPRGLGHVLQPNDHVEYPDGRIGQVIKGKGEVWKGEDFYSERDAAHPGHGAKIHMLEPGDEKKTDTFTIGSHKLKVGDTVVKEKNPRDDYDQERRHEVLGVNQDGTLQTKSGKLGTYGTFDKVVAKEGGIRDAPEGWDASDEEWNRRFNTGEKFAGGYSVRGTPGGGGWELVAPDGRRVANDGGGGELLSSAGAAKSKFKGLRNSDLKKAAREAKTGDTPAEKAAKAAGKPSAWSKIEGYDPKKGPSAEQKAANARKMGKDTPAEKAAKAAGKKPDFIFKDTNDPNSLGAGAKAAAAHVKAAAAKGAPKIESYDPKTGPSDAQKAANAARMGLKPKGKKKK